MKIAKKQGKTRGAKNDSSLEKMLHMGIWKKKIRLLTHHMMYFSDALTFQLIF